MFYLTQSLIFDRNKVQMEMKMFVLKNIEVPQIMSSVIEIEKKETTYSVQKFE